ncbi:nucleotidyltransferase domain-containing protein [Luteimonas marina]|uniref:Nucleotidyltransferase domain-containing protein n=1 Tax=Luteimonas marina TaxID=488485 RepID=A0A5C5TVI8_9GAMM|nr:nucleotidyltransferase domain-containing protein [Luteimonas marina]TWT17275.1 nucleotidyltransferase domain-containing protein [Luteimonas marina]
MSTLLSRLRNILENQPDIRQALVFGSVAVGAARHDSDLDIAVEATHPLDAEEKLRLIEALAETIGRPVDLIDLKTIGSPLLGQILKHGQRILGSDADHAELIRRHLFDTEDFQPYVERMLRERRQAWIG